MRRRRLDTNEIWKVVQRFIVAFIIVSAIVGSIYNPTSGKGSAPVENPSQTDTPATSSATNDPAPSTTPIIIIQSPEGTDCPTERPTRGIVSPTDEDKTVVDDGDDKEDEENKGEDMEPEESPAVEEPKVQLLTTVDKNTETKERILALFEFFVDYEGFTPEAAAGIIGNIAAESSYDPSAVSWDDYHGLCQWNTTDDGGHWWDGPGGIKEWLAENGYAVDSFEGQTRAILYCPKRGYLGEENLQKLKEMTSVEEAARFFCRKYEVGAGINTRVSEAIIAYGIYLNPETEYSGERPYVIPD